MASEQEQDKPAETPGTRYYPQAGGFGFQATFDTRQVGRNWQQNPGRTAISLDQGGNCVDADDWIEVHLFWDGPGPVWQEIGTPQRIPCRTGGTAAFDVGGDGPDWYWLELWAAYPGVQDRHITGNVSYP